MHLLALNFRTIKHHPTPQLIQSVDSLSASRWNLPLSVKILLIRTATSRCDGIVRAGANDASAYHYALQGAKQSSIRKSQQTIPRARNEHFQRLAKQSIAVDRFLDAPYSHPILITDRWFQDVFSTRLLSVAFSPVSQLGGLSPVGGGLHMVDVSPSLYLMLAPKFSNLHLLSSALLYRRSFALFV